MKTRDLRQFRRALRRFTRLIDRQLKTCCTQVTLAQCLVLLEIEDLGEPTMSELAAKVGLDTSTVTRTTDGLVERGQVERRRSAEDRRVVTVCLTPKGRRSCKAIHADNDAIWSRVFAHIPASERQDVLRHFEMLVQASIACEQAPGASSTTACRAPTTQA